VAEALKQHPKLNAAYDEDKQEITYHNAEHLAIAVDTDKGLLVPVISDAGNLILAGLAGKIADVADRTRSGKIGPDELSGGTFSITNIGSVGALFDTPIINQPQVGILGTGAIVKRPVVVQDENGDDSIAIRSMMYLSLTYDHRLVDGADAGRFLQTLKARLEEGAFEADLGLKPWDCSQLPKTTAVRTPVDCHRSPYRRRCLNRRRATRGFATGRRTDWLSWSHDYSL
jgi:2-oxoglutarate dehydrogenase E2 component (dihydrolipoamide succinyltransferase)